MFYDRAMEKAYNFNLERTCKMAKDNLANNIRLFEGYSFYFITQNGQHRKNKERNQEGFMSKQYVTTNMAPMVNVCGGRVKSEFSHVGIILFLFLSPTDFIIADV